MLTWAVMEVYLWAWASEAKDRDVPLSLEPAVANEPAFIVQCILSEQLYRLFKISDQI